MLCLFRPLVVSVTMCVGGLQQIIAGARGLYAVRLYDEYMYGGVVLVR